MKHRICTLIFALICASTATASAQMSASNSYPAMAPIGKYLMASPAAEIASARTAAPPSVVNDASILVLGKSGYYEAVHGTNGWVCFVERSWTAGLEDPEFWNYRGYSPNCFNPPAVASVLPQYLARTKWAIAGATREQIEERSKAAYASHEFTDPAPGSFSFMLSKHAYLGDQAAGPWHPHVMMFIAQSAAPTWAAGFDGSPVILGPNQTAYEPNCIYIPVRRWADGSFDFPPAPVPSPASK